MDASFHRTFAGMAAAISLLPGLLPLPAYAQVVNADAVAWDAMESTPEALRAVVRWKTLVGADIAAKPELLFGELEIAPQGIYPAHRHPSPEVYYVVSGRVRWTLGDQVFIAGPGTTINTLPNTSHRMENLGDDVARMVWIWWAPGGDTEVFAGKYEFTETLPAQPEDAHFPELRGADPIHNQQGEPHED